MQKHAASYTECRAANNRQLLFNNLKNNMKKGNSINSTSRVKDEITNIINELNAEGDLNISGIRKSIIINYIASNNEANIKSCSRDTIQDGFISTGEISRPTLSNNSNNQGFNSCPDLHQIIKCSKKVEVTNNIKAFIKKLHSIAKHYGTHGCTDEDYFDQHCNNKGEMIFSKDRMPDGRTTKEKKFSKQQYYLMRTYLIHWDAFLESERQRRLVIINKENDELKKSCEEAVELFLTNDKSETKFKEVSNETSIYQCTTSHFAKSNKDLMIGFIVGH